MRQECTEAMPEQMPLLAGDALHFFNEVVEVDGIKLPSFEQRGLPSPRRKNRGRRVRHWFPCSPPPLSAC